MKKIVLAMTVVILMTTTAMGQTINGIRTTHKDGPEKQPNEIAGKMVCNEELKWEPEVMVYNNTSLVPDLSHPVWSYVENLPGAGTACPRVYMNQFYKTFGPYGSTAKTTGKEIAPSAGLTTTVIGTPTTKATAQGQRLEIILRDDRAAAQPTTGPTATAIANGGISDADRIISAIREMQKPTVKVKKAVSKKAKVSVCYTCDVDIIKSAFNQDVGTFQKTNGLSCDGMPGPVTHAKLIELLAKKDPPPAAPSTKK